jgi:uncharacterized membrane protein YccC
MNRRLVLRHGPRLVQAVRMTTSSIVAFAIAQALALPQGFWAVITALIVTQSNVGGSLKAAFERFLGSVFGAIFGSAIALAIPHQHAPSQALALVLAVAPLSFLATISAGFRVAPITAIIVMLSTTGSTLGPLDFAIDRVLEVGLGCAVGLAVSVLIVPARASRLLLRSVARVMSLLADQLACLARVGEQTEPELRAKAIEIRASLVKLEGLVSEAARERRSRLTDTRDAEPLLLSLRRLRHDVVMLRRALRDPGHETLRDHLAQPWSRAMSAGADALRALGGAIKQGRPPAIDPAMNEAIRTYRAALDEVRHLGLTAALSTDAVLGLFGAAFALEEFRRDLEATVQAVKDLGPGEDAIHEESDTARAPKSR